MARNRIIPYTHFGISLITLLRIGVTPEQKDALYGQFLSLPLFVDMATWNIQWKAGKLAYVDVDTMDKTYEKVLPDVFATMLALANYERTVADFGHCPGHVKLLANIPNVGHCVKSRRDRRADKKRREEMGCTDSHPVPCDDGKCKPSFIHCLRDLYAQKKK